MRKGLLLTARDIEIFDHLSNGPATRRSIFNKIFKADSTNINTRERVMDKRLRKLQVAGYIKARTSASIKEVVFVLNDKAVSIVVEKAGVDPTSVWVKFNDNCLQHDLIVASAARKIIREGSKEKRYVLTYLELECGLKKYRVSQKGVGLPDLVFTFRAANQPVTCALEIDNATIGKKDFISKMRSWDNTTFVVTKNSNRLKMLIRYLEQARFEVNRPIYLATYAEFFKKTIFECPWHAQLQGGEITFSQIVHEYINDIRQNEPKKVVA
jgi:hypothetical protein